MNAVNRHCACLCVRKATEEWEKEVRVVRLRRTRCCRLHRTHLAATHYPLEHCRYARCATNRSLASSFSILFHSFIVVVGLLLSISSLFYFSQLDLFEITLVAMRVHAYEVCANKIAFKVVQNAMATGSWMDEYKKQRERMKTTTNGDDELPLRANST